VLAVVLVVYDSLDLRQAPLEQAVPRLAARAGTVA